MDKSILFAAIAGAVLIGAMFAVMQPINQASTAHIGLCRNLVAGLNTTAITDGEYSGDFSVVERDTIICV